MTRGATAFGRGVEHEAQGESSTKNRSACRSTCHAGYSAQEDKVRSSPFLAKVKKGSQPQARTRTPKKEIRA